MPDVRKQNFFAAHIAAAAIVALALGLVLGVLTKNSQNVLLLEVAAIAKPVGLLWTNALRMVVVPLMVSYLILAINSVPTMRTAGKLGGLTLVCMLVLLATAAIVGVFVSSSVISALPIGDETRAAFRALSSVAADTVATADTRASASDVIATLIPPNPFRALVEGDQVGILLTTALFAFAMMKIPADRRDLLIRVISAIADTARTLVHWIIMVLPVAAFALAFSTGAESGFSIATGLGYAVLAMSMILIVVTLLFYPLTLVAGRVGMGRFAAAVAPAQTVAAGTRSSLASLPSLVEGAEQKLGMRPQVAQFVLPFTVTTFKLNYVITQPFKLLFLTSMLGLELRPGFLITFVATVFLLSFTTVGIPSGGQLLTWPLLLSAGIPVEALVMIKIADAIPDIFKTILNVTADMSVATVVERFARVEEVPAVKIVGAA